MAINPPSQYADDSNLRTRQHLWELQDPPFDLVGWVLDLAGVDATGRVLDVGCSNGAYLRALRARRVDDDVVAFVHDEVQRVIDADGALLEHGDTGAFVCR
jgi:cyclopropane fatty-acyl-phospholipid synthase-like methyltransferase